MHRRYVLTHPEYGIYLGEFLGLGFWTKEDPAGQSEAVTFSSPKEALDFTELWDAVPEGVGATEVLIQKLPYATVEECVAAGLPAWDSRCVTAKEGA